MRSLAKSNDETDAETEMPKKKLQLKLLSNSGELLKVVTCHAGQVSVFRAKNQSDLRPYQRALAGSQGGAEKFSVVIDGNEYHPDEHNLVGFGEAPPYAGLTVIDYLTSLGVPEGAAEALLVSFGIEQSRVQPCSSLNPDQERRLRLIAATTDPEKALILNEPFEPVSHQWRERLAEFLISFARNQGGIVVVTSLSYRPECWIDNDQVARIQVGETLQKTIGFGATGSDDANLVQQLKEMIQSDPSLQQKSCGETTDRSQARVRTAATAATTFGGLGGAAEAYRRVDDAAWNAAEYAATSDLKQRPISDLFSAAGTSVERMLALVGGGAILIVSTYVTTKLLNASSDSTSPPSESVQVALAPKADTNKELAVVDDILSGSTQKNALSNQATNSTQPDQNTLPTEGVARVAPSASRSAGAIQPPTGLHVLDEYPEAIRVSLIETSRGIVDYSANATTSTSSPAPVDEAKPVETGNLFKLLESANETGKDTPDPAGSYGRDQYSAPQPQWQAPSYDPEAGDEQARREAIRQKFLEAIRSAAERRQAAGDEGL